MYRINMRKIIAAAVMAVSLVVPTVTAYADVIPYPKAVSEPGMLRGWLKDGSYYWFYDAANNQVADGFTDDGYYVGFDGRWQYKTINILGVEYKTVDQYMPSAAYGNFTETMLKELDKVNTGVQQYLGSTRIMRMNYDTIEYSRRDKDNKETVLLGLYKDPATGGWRLRVATNLGNKMYDMSQASTYDYVVFQYFLSRFTHEPELVSEAIYGSWQGMNPCGLNAENPVRVGDVKIKAVPVNGAADYYISDGRW